MDRTRAPTRRLTHLRVVDLRENPLRDDVSWGENCLVVSLAFKINDPQGAGALVRGRIRFGGSAVVLEFERAAIHDHAGLGLARKVVIDVEEFAACSFRRGVVGARLQLWALTEGALGGVPGAMEDAVALNFARDDRDAAEDLAARLRIAISDAQTRSGARGRARFVR